MTRRAFRPSGDTGTPTAALVGTAGRGWRLPGVARRPEKDELCRDLHELLGGADRGGRVVALERSAYGGEMLRERPTRAARGSPRASRPQTAAGEEPVDVLCAAQLLGEFDFGERELDPAAYPRSFCTSMPRELVAPKTRRLRSKDWPTIGSLSSEHAGLFLLVPELIELDLTGLGWRRRSGRPVRRRSKC